MLALLHALSASVTDAPGVLRFGIIGTGCIGQEHLRNLHLIPECQVVAIADNHEPSLAAGHDRRPLSPAWPPSRGCSARRPRWRSWHGWRYCGRALRQPERPPGCRRASSLHLEPLPQLNWMARAALEGRLYRHL